MRRSILVWVLLACFAPAALAEQPAPPAGNYTGQCRKMTRQIAHFATVADRARERDNELWENATLQHIERLSTRRARLCPEYAQKSSGEQLMKMLKDAAKIAAALFSWGLI